MVGTSNQSDPEMAIDPLEHVPSTSPRKRAPSATPGPSPLMAAPALDLPACAPFETAAVG